MNSLLLNEYAPLMYVCMATAGFSFQIFFQKVLNEEEFHDQFDAVFVKGLLQLVISGALVYFDDERIAFSRPVLGDSSSTTFIVLMRAVFHFLVIVFTFLALDTLPYGDAAVLALGGPVFAGALALLFLQEPWFLVEMVSLAVCLLGTVLVIKPPLIFNSFHGDNGGEHHQPHFRSYGVLYGLLAAVFSGCGFVTLRLLGTQCKLSWKNVCLVQAAVQASLAIPSVFLAHESFNLSLSWTEGWALLATGLAAALSQFCLTAGLQGVKVAVGSTLLLGQVVMGLVLQAAFIHDYAGAVSVLGALLVCVGFSLLMMYKKSDNDVVLYNTQRALELTHASDFSLTKPVGFSRSVLLSKILGGTASAGSQTYSPVPLYEADCSDEDSPPACADVYSLQLGHCARSEGSENGVASVLGSVESPVRGIMMVAGTDDGTPVVDGEHNTNPSPFSNSV